MIDGELLELAAKAAGLKVGTDEGSYDDLKWWNPLTDDGDALRLAAKLGMSVDMTLGKFVEASIIVDDKRISGICDCGPAPDYYAATRRAIVRAAAAIGKAMP